MTRQERRQARIERYRNLAANARQQSNELFQRSNDMAFIIPCGQPVHGAADRKYRDRIWETMGRSVKIERKADYFDRKAEAAENNNAIYLEDDDSIQRLEAKIKRLNGLQEKMKAANKILRNKKLTETEKIAQLKELGFSEKDAASCLIPDSMGEIGFPSWQLSNNNAVIRNAKQRLEKAIRLKTTESKEYKINGVRVVENTEENRLQLFFDGKPEQDVIMNLKYNGFRWAPSLGCWQSYLNRYQIERAKSIL